MSVNFHPMKSLPKNHNYKKGDLLIVFGELFQRGYANGIVDEALKIGMKVIYSTVGRRDSDLNLRPLTAEEIKEKNVDNLINIPLEAGFDFTVTKSGVRPVDLIKNTKLGDWQTAKVDKDILNEAKELSIADFRKRVKQYMSELEKYITDSSNVLFVHTMAGGVPRAKIIMPAMNRVFKGAGDRYASSEEFWSSDLGYFCQENFDQVTGYTLQHLIDLSEPIRNKVIKNGKNMSYVAYGYHGTEILINNSYQWQSYSPYLQGFAKLTLEKIATQEFKNNIKVSVFNAPEILTNSSSIFLGVEVSLYSLLGALTLELGDKAYASHFVNECLSLLKPEMNLEKIMAYTNEYFNSDTIKKWSIFDQWPQHNGPDQMEMMRAASSTLIDFHLDAKNLMTYPLSEVVFRGCGHIMLNESFIPSKPVWWLGHDIVAQAWGELESNSIKYEDSSS